MFCQYKNILGKVGKGIHSIRIYNISVIDVILTFLAAYLINRVYPQFNYLTILFFLFLSGIFLHRLFCVRTTIDKWLFPKK
jgi:hypothetical protein